MRAVSFSDDPGRAAAYFSEGRRPTRLRNADKARDEMVAALELSDELDAHIGLDEFDEEGE